MSLCGCQIDITNIWNKGSTTFEVEYWGKLDRALSIDGMSQASPHDGGIQRRHAEASEYFLLFLCEKRAGPTLFPRRVSYM